MLSPDKPLASQALIDYLDSVFPDHAPDKTTADRQVWIDVGSVLVVRKLKADLAATLTKEED